MIFHTVWQAAVHVARHLDLDLRVILADPPHISVHFVSHPTTIMDSQSQVLDMHSHNVDMLLAGTTSPDPDFPDSIASATSLLHRAVTNLATHPPDATDVTSMNLFVLVEAALRYHILATSGHWLLDYNRLLDVFDDEDTNDESDQDDSRPPMKSNPLPQSAAIRLSDEEYTAQHALLQEANSLQQSTSQSPQNDHPEYDAQYLALKQRELLVLSNMLEEAQTLRLEDELNQPQPILNPYYSMGSLLHRTAAIGMT